MASKTLGLTIARVAAVAIALGLGTWLVVRAQSGAEPDKGTPAPIEQPDGTTPAAGEGGESFGNTDENTKPPVFLPSSKSSIGVMPPKDEGAKKPKQKAKKKPVFLPSSKSLPPPPADDEDKEEKKAPPPKKAPKKIW